VIYLSSVFLLIHKEYNYNYYYYYYQ